MIIDLAQNILVYEKLLPGLRQGLESLKALGETPQVGRYEFDGGFFMVQRGQSTPAVEGDFEAHVKYIDVQIILGGSEMVIWNDISRLKESEPYDAQKERTMYSGEVEFAYKVAAGMAWVAFPNDAHKACRDFGERTPYYKVVMKLPA